MALCDIRRHQVDKGAARSSAGVVDDQIGRGDLALNQAEQALDVTGIGGVAGKGARAGLAAERAKFFDFARRQRDANALACK